MRVTDQTLLEQIRITEFELGHRKAALGFTADDEAALGACRTLVTERLEQIVAEFYQIQTSTPEIALLIGDADTLHRLRNAQRRYILDLFSGLYDLEYVNNRLRIGLVHKRIGVEPKLYLSAMYVLKRLLKQSLSAAGLEATTLERVLVAMEKLTYFDITLVFETYIRSMVSEIDAARNRSEEYARNLEATVRERTQQLEEIARIDPLTGLINRRYLQDALTQSLRTAQRRAEPISIAFLDIDHFKQINDTLGHHRGDEVLSAIGAALLSFSRAADSCFRYGGDEFCVILPNCRETDAMVLYCQRLQDHVAQTIPDISLSVGICSTGPNEYIEANEMLSRADTRMYEAKALVHRNGNGNGDERIPAAVTPSGDNPNTQ
jgi:diguanylate cyclase